MRVAVVFCALLVAVGCQRKAVGDGEEAKGAEPSATSAGPPASAEERYRLDVDNICNAEERSGALDLDEGSRPIHVARWLGENIHTEQGRQFLAELARAEPAAKVALLNGEAAKHGMKGCALAVAWSGGPTPAK